MEPSQYSIPDLLWYALLVFLCGAIVVGLLLFWISPSCNRYAKEQMRSLRDTLANANWVIALLLTVILLLIIDGMARNNIGITFREASDLQAAGPKKESHGSFTKVDIVIIISFAIGAIGAIWAILARIDAEKAFKESQRTRLSFGNSFKFESILCEDQHNYKIPNIIDHIGDPNTVVSLYIGYPIIAWFYKYKMNMASEINTVFYKLINKMEEVARIDREPDFELYLGVFSNEEIDTIAKAATTDQTQHSNMIALYKDALEKLKQKKKDPRWAERLILIDDIPRNGEKFRFATVHNSKRGLHKALIWVIPDFRPKNHVNFESACFQTQDISIIEMLHNIFQDARTQEKQAAEEVDPALN